MYAIRPPETFDEFRRAVCVSCTANDWYCPTDCEFLEKAAKLDFRDIQKSYVRNDGDIVKVSRFIRRKYKREMQRGKFRKSFGRLPGRT